MPSLFFDAFVRFGPKPRQNRNQPYTLDHLVAEMRHCSISGALVAHTSQTVYDPMFENRRLIERIKPYDFLFPIWNVFPHWSSEMPAPRDLTRQMTDCNVRAVMLNPNTHGFGLLSRHTRPLLDELERNATFTMIDMAETNARDLEDLLVRHPALPVYLRGASWSAGHHVFPLVMNHRNLHLAFDFFQSNHAIEYLIRHGHEDQLVYCSNATDMAMGSHRFYVDYADAPLATRTKIASGNLIRLLKGLKPPREIVNTNEDAVMAEAREGKPLSPLVLDFHVHMLDEGLNGAGGGYAMLDGGPTGVRKLGQRMGVKGMGIMSWNGTVGAQADDGNQCVKAAINAYPDYYWGLGTFDVMHLSAEQMTAQMEQLFADKRFLGLKPYPSYGIPYSDKRYDAWWEFGNKRKLYCALHPVNWYQAGEFDSICSRFPDLTVIAYHVGGSYDIADTCIGLAKKFPNFYMELTLTPVCLGIVDYLVQNTSADRVLYGSDLPMRDPRQQLGWVVYSRMSYADKLKVLGGNAKRIVDHVRANQR